MLRNRENVQGESATKGHVEHINLSQAPRAKWSVMAKSANKRRKLLSVLCSSSSDEVKSQQGHMAQLRLA